MRPDLREDQSSPRYRRRKSRDNGNSVRIAIILVVSIGIVAAAFVLTNVYEFNTVLDPTATPKTNNETVNRPSGKSTSGVTDLVSPDGSNNSTTTNNGSGTTADSSE